MLDEQRPAPVPGARKEVAASGASGAFAQRATPSWEQRGDIRFVVTGSVSVGFTAGPRRPGALRLPQGLDVDPDLDVVAQHRPAPLQHPVVHARRSPAG